VSVANLAEVRLPDHVSKSRPGLVQGKRMKRAPNEKECRVLMVSPLRNNSASSSSGNSNSSNSNSNKGAARLLQRTKARVAGSRKVGKEGHQKKRRRRGRNNFGTNNTNGSGT
jgi:hypothetical protein